MEKHGTNIEETLAERETQHGPFREHALIELKLRNILETHGGRLSPAQKIALGMIFHKTSRILNGGSRHSDTWHDIAGYSILAENEILNE